MQIPEKTREEIEARFSKMSDFLKMEYLEACSKEKVDMAIKRFCHQELSKLYEAKKMFSEAARNTDSVAEMGTTYKEKIQSYLYETGLWIKSGVYDKAEESFRMALACGTDKEKEEAKKAVIDMYKIQAALFEKENKNSNALKIYEKLLRMVPEDEKLDIKKKILPLYNKLGKITEYTLLSQQLGEH